MTYADGAGELTAKLLKLGQTSKINSLRAATRPQLSKIS